MSAPQTTASTTAAGGRTSAGVTRQSLLARLHCLKKEAGWDDETYRDILQAKTGKRSSTELDFRSLSRAVAMIAEEVKRLSRGVTKAASPALKANEWAFIDSAAEEKRALLRKICAICRAMGKSEAWAEGVARRHSGGVDRRLEMMAYDELYKVAQAIANTQRHAQKKGASAADAAAETTPASTEGEAS